MSRPIRATYHHGHLRLLDPVDLAEGQEIHMVILSARDRARAALSDLLAEVPGQPDEELDEAALLKEIEEEFRGQPTLSETIIEERRTGP